MEKPVIKFKYICSPLYNPVYINGAYGGVSPQGEINVNFYLERKGLPKYHEFYVDNKGKMTEKSIIPEDHKMSMVRVVETGITMNLRGAKGVHKWLGAKIKELEQLEEEAKTKKTDG